MKFHIIALCFALNLAGMTSSEKSVDQIPLNSLENSSPLVPSLCLLPHEKGNCNSHILRYFYNSASQSCEAFIYSGCNGNGNNFDSVKCCLNTCKPNKNRNNNN